jgi:hypothetical protein
VSGGRPLIEAAARRGLRILVLLPEATFDAPPKRDIRPQASFNVGVAMVICVYPPSRVRIPCALIVWPRQRPVQTQFILSPSSENQTVPSTQPPPGSVARLTVIVD